MKNKERSMLLVKPDGVRNGLVPEIKKIILDSGLEITKEVRTRVSPQTVADLYREIKDIPYRDYFPLVLAFVSSSNVHLFVVEGEDAVLKIRNIVGSRVPPTGLRGKYAESMVKNVAHGSHSVAAAENEIKVILEGAISETKLKKVFILGGMSESGKSSSGRYLDSQGAVRLKIIFFLKMVQIQEGNTEEFYSWNDRNQAERPDWLAEQFIAAFINWTREQGIQYCCLESLYGPEFGVKLREALDPGVGVIVYVDIPQEVRLERQVIRKNLPSIEEAKKILLPRDEKKAAWKVPEIKTVADEVIDNSGTIEDLEAALLSMLRNHGISNEE